MTNLKSNAKYMAKLAIKKSLLKEYRTSESDRTVYLNDGDEFQIQLFNPEQNVIGAEIYIDNERLSNMIVLNPGERMWLERYTDKAKKFMFKIYEVNGKSKEVKKAIAHNGEITVKFYRKRQKYYNEINRITIDNKPYDLWYNNYNNTKDWHEYNYTITCDDGNNSVNTAQTTLDCNLNTLNGVNYAFCSCDSAIEPASVCTTSLSACVEPTITWATSDNNGHYTFGSNKPKGTIETGRVSEGGYSSQRFETVDIDFEYLPFTTENIKILPTSRKPYTPADSVKLYCTECGHKINTKFKYCPYCGAKID